MNLPLPHVLWENQAPGSISKFCHDPSQLHHGLSECTYQQSLYDIPDMHQNPEVLPVQGKWLILVMRVTTSKTPKFRMGPHSYVITFDHAEKINSCQVLPIEPLIRKEASLLIIR